nr:U7 snRNA-associated Sm-like protein LSm11 [Vulpes vulpes]
MEGRALSQGASRCGPSGVSGGRRPEQLRAVSCVGEILTLLLRYSDCQGKISLYVANGFGSAHEALCFIGPAEHEEQLLMLHEGSPLGELHRCIREGVKVNVHIRTFKGLRGVCTGFLVAFDKFWNMALTDVDETYRKPVLGKAYERDSSLTLTRLFDRLKLQDSSKKEADSKSAVEDSTLSRYSQTSTWKVASVWGRGDTDRGSRRRSRSVPSSLQASAREESRSEMSGRTTRTEGSSAGGTFSRATTLSRGQPRKKKRKPKVDYQQVFTRHINQIFIRGENVLLVHLAQ